MAQPIRPLDPSPADRASAAPGHDAPPRTSASTAEEMHHNWWKPALPIAIIAIALIAGIVWWFSHTSL